MQEGPAAWPPRPETPTLPGPQGTEPLAGAEVQKRKPRWRRLNRHRDGVRNGLGQGWGQCCHELGSASQLSISTPVTQAQVFLGKCRFLPCPGVYN